MNSDISTTPSIESNVSNVVSFAPPTGACAELTGCARRKDRSGALPAGFLIEEDGIYELRFTDGDETLVGLCSSILVLGICRSPGGRGWGRVVEVSDPDGGRHRHVIDEALLAGKPEASLRPLFDLGLVLEPIDKASQSVQHLLRAWRPDVRFTRVHACGWVDEPPRSFVLSNGKLAARYLLRCADGDRAELMFEKGPRTPANLWMAHARVAGLLVEPGLHFQSSPASNLFTAKGSDGQPIYGRHSALKSMRELEHADLICFRITTVAELDHVLDHLSG